MAENKNKKPVVKKLKVGPYKISKRTPGLTEEKTTNSIWIENESGEGMGIDLDVLWKEWY